MKAIASVLLVTLVLGLVLTACGRRNAPEAPPNSEFPRIYPDPKDQ